jgi:hypothetical protein
LHVDQPQVGQFTATNYPDSKNKNAFEDGLRFQDFAVEQLARRYGFIIQLYSSRHYQFNHGESVQRCEFKLDKRFIETGRLSIEVAERTALDKQWVSSGIYSATLPVFYVQGNHDQFFVFDRRWLARYHQQKLKGKYEEKPTIRTFYMPIDTAEEYSLLSIDCTPAE